MLLLQEIRQLFPGVFPLGYRKVFRAIVVVVITYTDIYAANAAAENLQIATAGLLIVQKSQLLFNIELKRLRIVHLIIQAAVFPAPIQLNHKSVLVYLTESFFVFPEEIFDVYRSYASADLSAPLEDLYSVTENAGATGKLSLTIDLDTRIGIAYKVTLPEGIAAEDAKLVIKDAAGNELETFDLANASVDGKGRYCVTFFGSTSRDMRRVVYATAYANSETITGTYAYSIASYAYLIANTTGVSASMVDMTKRMAIYGDSAEAYFSD